MKKIQTIVLLILMSTMLCMAQNYQGRDASAKQATVPADTLKKSTPVTSGTFSDQDNGESSANLKGLKATTDVTYTDDVVIRGSLAVGDEAVTNQNFGANTVILQENNVRLHFDDTSDTGNFPANDWTLVANDMHEGGLNYFSIFDATCGRSIFTLEAGALSNSLYVRNNGYIGINTNIPKKNLHIVDGNSPGIRLEQDNSIGWDAYTWEIAGNETSFFIQDVSNGNTLPFRIDKRTPTNTLYLKNNGYVGIGTNRPTCQLDITGILQVGNDETITPAEGMIRYQQNQFEGYDGTAWKPFSQQAEVDELKARIAVLETIIDDLNVPTSDNGGGVSPSDVVLEQNAPNPFSDQTTIAYQIPEASTNAFIIIYDLTGKQLKKTAIQGSGSITVTAAELYEGMFIYSLVINGQLVESKRMTLTK